MQPLVNLGPRSCRWPLLNVPRGQGATQMFCGCTKPDDPDQPYCLRHAEIAFVGQTTAEGRRWRRLEAIRTAMGRLALRKALGMSRAKISHGA